MDGVLKSCIRRSFDSAACVDGNQWNFPGIHDFHIFRSRWFGGKASDLFRFGIRALKCQRPPFPRACTLSSVAAGADDHNIFPAKAPTGVLFNALPLDGHAVGLHLPPGEKVKAVRATVSITRFITSAFLAHD